MTSTGLDMERLATWIARQASDDSVRIDGMDQIDVGHSAEMAMLTLVSDRDGARDRKEVVVRLRPPSPGLLEPLEPAPAPDRPREATPEARRVTEPPPARRVTEPPPAATPARPDDSKPPPADKPPPSPGKTPEEMTPKIKKKNLSHRFQGAVEVAISVGYSAWVTYEDTVYCGQIDPDDNEPKTFCQGLNPVSIDIGLAFAGALPSDEVRGYLEGRIAQLEEILPHLAEHKAEILAMEDVPRRAAAVFEHSAVHFEAELAWTRNLLAEMEQEDF